MAINAYDKGDKIRIQGTFKDIDGALVDPTTVTFTAKDPDGTISTLTTVRSSVGVYYADLSLTKAGTYFYRSVGTAPAVAAEEGEIFVRDSNV